MDGLIVVARIAMSIMALLNMPARPGDCAGRPTRAPALRLPAPGWP